METEKMGIPEQVAIIQAMEQIRFGGIVELQAKEGQKIVLKMQEISQEKLRWKYAG